MVLPIAPTLSTVLCLVSIFLTFRNVRYENLKMMNCMNECFVCSDHLHRAARNDLSFLPESLPSNARKLVS